jgi:hypothetical protein
LPKHILSESIIMSNKTWFFKKIEIINSKLLTIWLNLV